MSGAPTRRDLLGQPHHDGSALYVSNPCPALGERVDVLRPRARSRRRSTPSTCAPRPTASAIFTVAARVRTTGDRRLVARRRSTCHNPVTNYRFMLDGRPDEVPWLNGTGVHERDVPDAGDFRLVAHRAPPPAWALGAVVYQIFPDRFARSRRAGPPRTPRTGPIPAGWVRPRRPQPKGVAQQLYGGDLDGITEHLDHLDVARRQRRLPDAVLPGPLQPPLRRVVASSRSTRVLGGDAALAPPRRRRARARHEGDGRLHDEPHRRRPRVVPSPPRQDPDADGAGLLHLGGRELRRVARRARPCRSSTTTTRALRHRIFEDPEGVVRKWLGRRRRARRLAGRRRQHDGPLGATTDLNHDVARQMRDVMGGVAPDALLVGEHFHDYTPDVPGDGWHGVMNYAGFSGRPGPGCAGAEGPALPRRPGAGALPRRRARSWRRCATSRRASPWQSLVQHSFNLVGSHDSAADPHARRARTPGGGRGRRAAVHRSRRCRCSPTATRSAWRARSARTAAAPCRGTSDGWDAAHCSRSTAGSSPRARSSVALRRGGLRWVHAEGDAMVFLRETPSTRWRSSTVARAAHEPVVLGR